MAKDYKICSRCVMDNTIDTSITFNLQGQCNYCTDVLNRMKLEYFPNDIGRSKLNSVIDKIKKESVGNQYDCIIGISGGVDSSYVLYLAYQYNLRVLAVHIDDGLDTEIAMKNIHNLCEKANAELLIVKPDKKQYKDLLLSFFKASVPNLAMPQDNILIASLFDTIKQNQTKYILVGDNFSMESILERPSGINNAYDKKHIFALQKLFGTQPIDKLKILSLFEFYILRRYFQNIVKVVPLNYMDYNLQKALDELKAFSGYTYYGGKHYESILTRFLQCYYLPVKYGFDKRKSHFSSMIISGQMTREEALMRMKQPLYPNVELMQSDFEFIADYLNISRSEFDSILSLPPKQHNDYPISFFNQFAGLARVFRRYLG